MLAALVWMEAVLAPGYEDVAWCPKGSCLRPVHNPDGFVGPRSAMVECWDPHAWFSPLDEVRPSPMQLLPGSRKPELGRRRLRGMHAPTRSAPRRLRRSGPGPKWWLIFRRTSPARTRPLPRPRPPRRLPPLLPLPLRPLPLRRRCTSACCTPAHSLASSKSSPPSAWRPTRPTTAWWAAPRVGWGPGRRWLTPTSRRCPRTPCRRRTGTHTAAASLMDGTWQCPERSR
jgi:hypothetical protein